MFKVIYNENTKKPIKSWASEIEESALEQAINLSNHPAAFHHIALMADCHSGYGMPIGGVMACDKAIIPNAVGLDIGCGVIKSSSDFVIDTDIKESLKKVVNTLNGLIPVGMNWHTEDQDWEDFNSFGSIRSEIVDKKVPRARKQLGTLGGGNHFIELQKDENNHLSIMIHSGSRNFGKQIAEYYHKKAVALCEKWFSNIPNKDLSFLPFDDPVGREYFEAMNCAMDFAKENRKRMLAVVKDVVRDEFGCSFAKDLDVHHNYAAWENHFGKNVIVHRKGAIRARLGEIGIVPGSMGTPSFIVKGLENPDSFYSCSHGAGRRMGRREATRTLTLKECDDSMENVIFNGWGKSRSGDIDLGEAPQAYKDIEEVISLQSDLVTPILKLVPLAVLKG
jgi:tRNA-splicing ligase RtcB (3'-phosphate/5'-hydroxy nucleic acid ligase)